MNEFIDSHAHLTCDETTYSNVDAILERASHAGVKQIVNICTTLESLEKGILLHKKYPNVFNSCSITPHDVETLGETSFSKIRDAAKNGHLVAIGETGLDYYYSHSKVDIQKKFLRKYLELALECKLPVVIHCRDAFKDFFEILDQEYRINNHFGKGVLHCFTGNMEEAIGVIERGFYISLSGIVTFKKSLELKEIAKFVPLEKLLIETDTPYLAPQTRRGKPNEPAFLIETAEIISQIKEIPLEELMKVTSRNAKELFALS